MNSAEILRTLYVTCSHSLFITGQVHSTINLSWWEIFGRWLWNLKMLALFSSLWPSIWTWQSVSLALDHQEGFPSLSTESKLKPNSISSNLILTMLWYYYDITWKLDGFRTFTTGLFECKMCCKFRFQPGVHVWKRHGRTEGKQWLTIENSATDFTYTYRIWSIWRSPKNCFVSFQETHWMPQIQAHSDPFFEMHFGRSVLVSRIDFLQYKWIQGQAKKIQ